MDQHISRLDTNADDSGQQLSTPERKCINGPE
jgi:hypothetical protein